ncbi:signal recognition particle protein [Candidatus Dependentiae bacterium]|nr:MAG: signal recognition particle protein [Candidatus Dependentiae bacterium]
MFDFLSKKFSSIFSKVRGKKTLDVATIDAALEQVEDALLSADVPYDLVQTFAQEIKDDLVGKKVTTSLQADEQLMKVVNDRLVAFLGGDKSIFSPQIPSVIMVMGLQGSGKTTTIAKLAHYMAQEGKKRGKERRILMASVDYYRPAAIDQLEQLSKRAQISFFRAQSNDPITAACEIYDYWRSNNYEFLLLDTAGRLHVDNRMLEELRILDSRLQPKHKLLILDAMTGQESLAVARAFEQGVGFQGAILTKIDSDTRGGAAFSFRYALKKPIIFMGSGEKLEDLEQFYPERSASRMLGMGDIKSLIEHAEQKIKADEQQSVYRSFQNGKMNLEDFAQQMDMINKLGSLSSIMKYMPGAGNLSVSQDQLDQGQQEMNRFRAIMSSMTRKERLYPPLLNDSRKKRVAKGAGVAVGEVNKLLSRFDHMQQYAKLIKKSGGFGRLFK